MPDDPVPGPTGESVQRRLITAAGLVALLVLIPVLAPVREGLALPPGVLPKPELTGGLRFDEILFGVGTSFGDGAGLVLVAGALVGVLIAMGMWRDAIFVAFSVVSASIVVRLAKDVFDAPRPPTVGLYSDLVPRIPNMAVVVIALIIILGGLLTPWRRLTFVTGAFLLLLLAGVVLGARLVPVIRGFDSFPSGHAMNSMALACAFAFVAFRRWPQRRWIILLVAGYALLIGVSRIYLGTHFLSEVLAGWALAVAWVYVCWLVWLELDEPASRIT